MRHSHILWYNKRDRIFLLGNRFSPLTFVVSSSSRAFPFLFPVNCWACEPLSTRKKKKKRKKEFTFHSIIPKNRGTFSFMSKKVTKSHVKKTVASVTLCLSGHILQCWCYFVPPQPQAMTVLSLNYLTKYRQPRVTSDTITMEGAVKNNHRNRRV